MAANWTQQGIHEGHAQPEPVPCVYGVNSVVLIGKLFFEMTPSKVYVENAMTSLLFPVMGGVSVLCLLFVLSMCLHVQKMRLKYKRAMRSIEEGTADDDEDKDDDDDNGDDDDEVKTLKEKKEKRKGKSQKKRKGKRKGFFVMLGNGPQHLGIKK